MSRLLDLLRRPRRDRPGAASGDPREAGRRAPATPAGRAIVLDALSGARARGTWNRRRLIPVLAPLALAAVVFCLFVFVGSGRRTGRDVSAVSPRSPSTAASRAPLPAAISQPAAADIPPNPAPPAPLPERAPRRSGPAPSDISRPRAATTGAEPSETRAATPVQGGRDAAEDDEPFTRALRYQQRGDVENAIAAYRALLEADQSNAPAHNNLGLLYRSQGRAQDAIAEFGRAIAIDPAYGKARNNLGVTLLGAGNVEAAAREFRVALSLDPRNQEAMINLALSERAAGRADQARETLIRAIEIADGNAVAHYNLALLYDDAGEIGRAVEHYEAYLKYAKGRDAAQSAAVRDRCQALRERLIRFRP